MASDLKFDLVMTAFQRRPHVKLMGNPAVAFIYPVHKLPLHETYTENVQIIRSHQQTSV